MLQPKHTKKKKEYKRNTEESHQIIRQKKKGEKRPIKTNPKQLRKRQ